MNTMNMPAFTAETSLYRSSRHYRQQSTVYFDSFGRNILPALLDLGSLEPRTFTPCPPLLNQKLPYIPPTCYVEGVRGTMDCYQICDFYYRWVFRPFGGGISCELTVPIPCGPPVCGPCYKLNDVDPPVIVVDPPIL